jgi:hypothetical protein
VFTFASAQKRNKKVVFCSRHASDKNFQKSHQIFSAEMVEQHRRRRRSDVENRIDENNNNGTHRNVRKRRDLVCTIAHAKTFSQVLSGIQLTPTKRGGQKVKAWISNRGIGFITLDQSKSLKATAIFRRGTFERFRVGFGRGRNQGEEEDEEATKSREGVVAEEEESRRGKEATVVLEQRGIITRITETNRRRKKRLKST